MAGRWVNIPFEPKRFPFFYGWVIVAATTIGTIASIPGQTMGVGVFTDSLLEALGLTRTQLTLAYMLGTIGSSFILPYAGKLLDRIGSRAMVVFAATGLAVSMLALSVSGKVANMAALKSTSASMAVIFFCYLLMRFFGQGSLTVTSRVTLGKWFNHRRGRAAAISGIFISFGFSVAPRLLNWLLENHGWRQTCWILAAAVGGGMALIGWLFYRDNPEQCGLVMDGIKDEKWLAKQAAKVTATKRDFERPEAIRTIAFWAFSLGMAVEALVKTAVSFHITSLGELAGLDRAQSYQPFLPMAYFGCVTLVVGSILSDRMRLKWLLLVMMLAELTGSVGLLHLSETWGRWMLIAGYGIAGGLFGTLITVSLPRFFGRKHLGAIAGLNMSILVFASAIGPWLFAKAEELTGSYDLMIKCCWILPLTVAVASFWADNPQERS